MIIIRYNERNNKQNIYNPFSFSVRSFIHISKSYDFQVANLHLYFYVKKIIYIYIFIHGTWKLRARERKRERKQNL